MRVGRWGLTADSPQRGGLHECAHAGADHPRHLEAPPARRRLCRLKHASSPKPLLYLLCDSSCQRGGGGAPPPPTPARWGGSPVRGGGSPARSEVADSIKMALATQLPSNRSSSNSSPPRPPPPPPPPPPRSRSWRKRAKHTSFLDMWEKWVRHMWEKRLVGDFVFLAEGEAAPELRRSERSVHGAARGAQRTDSPRAADGANPKVDPEREERVARAASAFLPPLR